MHLLTINKKMELTNNFSSIKTILLILFISVLSLSSCDHIGSTKVANLIDLTPKLEKDSKQQKLLLQSNSQDPFTVEGKTKKRGVYKINPYALISEPAIAQNIVYSVSSRGIVAAFSLKEKKMLWQSDILDVGYDNSLNKGGILYSNGKLYVTNGTRYLVILDAQTGDELFRKEFPDILRSKPALADENLLLLQTANNQVISYDINKYEFVWGQTGGAETISVQHHIDPFVYDGKAIISYSSGEVLYLDTKTGTVQWSYMVGTVADVALPSLDPEVLVTKPIIDRNHAYFATSNGALVKIDVNSGKQIWKKIAYDIQSMVMHNGNLFITNNARQVAAISGDKGEVIWIGDLISPAERKKTRPAAVLFQAPFFTKVRDTSGVERVALNIIASNGQLYRFVQEANGELASDPEIVKIEKGAAYSWISCCDGTLYIFTNKTVSF